MIRAKPWNGKDLKGDWQVTYKIDGVRALWNTAAWVSRAGKPLYNLPHPNDVCRASSMGDVWDCEVYCAEPGKTSAENFKRTIQMVRSKSGKYGEIKPECLYSLDPLDARLLVSGPILRNPSALYIKNRLSSALLRGYEGLVLRQGDKWLKVKPKDSYDVRVTGAIEGTGKHKGRLGALVTAYGKVGTGFTDDDRGYLWTWFKRRHPDSDRPPLVGAIIEVECMHVTADGKFRHPRFMRLRPDRDDETPPQPQEHTA